MRRQNPVGRGKIKWSVFHVDFLENKMVGFDENATEGE